MSSSGTPSGSTFIPSCIPGSPPERPNARPGERMSSATRGTRIGADGGRIWLGVRVIGGSGGSVKTGERGVVTKFELTEVSLLGRAVVVGTGEAVHLYP